MKEILSALFVFSWLLISFNAGAEVTMPKDTYLRCGNEYVTIETSLKQKLSNLTGSELTTGVSVFQLSKERRVNRDIMRPSYLGVVYDTAIRVTEGNFTKFRIDRVKLTLEDAALSSGSFGTVIYINPRRCEIVSKSNMETLIDDHNKSVGSAKF